MSHARFNCEPPNFYGSKRRLKVRIELLKGALLSLLSTLVIASLMALAIPELSTIVKRPNDPPFGDIVLKAGENVGTFAWFGELEIIKNIDVVYDTHAQGRKAEITFGNFDVGAGELQF